MRLVVAALLLIAQSHPVVAEKHRRNFLDFSAKGSEYRVLEDLRLVADDIQYTETKQTEILGRLYVGSMYVLRTKVNVQTLCALGDGSAGMQTYERLPAEFEIYVVEDRDNALHNQMVEAMYSTWKRNEVFSGEYYYDFSVKDDHYALSALPDLVNVKGFFIVWIKGRVVKVVFRGFTDKERSGWGVMDGFNEDNLRVRIGNAEFRAYQQTAGVRREFVKLYKRGYFSPAKASAEQPRIVQ